MRKIIPGAALIAVAAPVAPVLADPPPWAPAHGRRAKEQQIRGQYYSGPVWEGRDGRVYCRRSNGTTGLIIGAGAVLGAVVNGKQYYRDTYNRCYYVDQYGRPIYDNNVRC